MILHTIRDEEGREVLEWEEASPRTNLLANLGRDSHVVRIPEEWLMRSDWASVEAFQRLLQHAQEVLWARGLETRLEREMIRFETILEWRPAPPPRELAHT